MRLFCGGRRFSVAQKESGTGPPSATAAASSSLLHNSTQLPPCQEVAAAPLSSQSPTLLHAQHEVVERAELAGDRVEGGSITRRPTPPPPPSHLQPSAGATSVEASVHGPFTPPLPAPSSILMGNPVRTAVEPANRPGRRSSSSRGGSPSLGTTTTTTITTSAHPGLPTLRLDRPRLPPLSVTDVSAPAVRRARGDDAESWAALCSSNAAATPPAMARRGSVRFISTHATDCANAEVAAVDAAAGRGSCEMVTPRDGTPQRRGVDGHPSRSDRTSDLSSRSGSLRPDSPAVMSETHDTLPPPGLGGAAVGDVDSCYVPLRFTEGEEENAGVGPASGGRGVSRGRGCGLLPASGSMGTPTSAASFPSPTSILLKSTAATSPSSNGTTLGNATHPSWHSSPHGWGSRRGQRATTPVRRHSGGSTPHFVESDLQMIEQQQQQQQQQLGRHDSDSSDDARTVESAVSIFARLQRGHGAAHESTSTHNRRQRQKTPPPLLEARSENPLAKNKSNYDKEKSV